jgi:hypothetical protein
MVAIMTHDGVASPSVSGPGPWATAVSYDAVADEIRLVLESGITVVIPRRVVPELRDAPASHMFDLTLHGDGEMLECRAEDVHLLVPGLLWDLVGFDQPVPCWSGKTPETKPNGRKRNVPPHEARRGSHLTRPN